mmetsp:Transcript_5456/g.8475  ORF Transcript_5456/g.8475 Transcript_5456/m.8475 type:complete len:105 (-) Transcript_5456:96-410(-)
MDGTDSSPALRGLIVLLRGPRPEGLKFLGEKFIVDGAMELVSSTEMRSFPITSFRAMVRMFRSKIIRRKGIQAGSSESRIQTRSSLYTYQPASEVGLSATTFVE